jgi:signal transduction histidine kinase/DNA-binding CsgD family transcriptional regulator
MLVAKTARANAGEHGKTSVDFPLKHSSSSWYAEEREEIFMVPSDLLLQLIAHLQSDDSVAHGRRALLDYLRKSTGASLGLVLVLHRGDNVLTLLERCGRRPRHPARSRPDSIELPRKEIFDPRHIPLDGVFYHALHMQGILHVPDLFSDPLSLEEERYWASPGAHVILGAIGAKAQHNSPQGLLVLCFSSRHKEADKARAGTQPAIDEVSLLIGISLLSVYLSDSEKDALSTLYKLHIAEQKALIEQERSRIAHDIHAGVVQQIAYVLRKLEFVQRTLEKQFTTEAALHEIAQASTILEATLNDLRLDISSLIPRQLEELGFNTILQALLDNYALNEPGLEIRYHIDDPNMIPSTLEDPVFRFIQEALNNVRKHARASHVTIRIHMLSGSLTVQVSDNGTGFLPEQEIKGAQPGQHVGLRLVREHIERAGGILEIRSKSGEGTTLKARFPLTSPAVILTNREQEVLRLLVEGSSNQTIARQLSVSIETVKSHVHHIMQKMHVKGRTQAAVVATKQHWL